MVSEGIILYFLNQVRGSVLFVLFNVLTQKATGIFRVAIGLKLGLFPFFYWVPAVIGSLSWRGCLVIRTLQKLVPFFSLIIFSSQFSLIVFISLVRIYYSGTLGVRAVSLRSFIGFSRIGNTGWAVLCLIVRPSFFIFFIVLYFTLLRLLFWQFYSFSNLNSVFKKSSSFWIRFFVLSGIPPFGVFGIKAVLLICFLEISLAFSSLLVLGATLPLLYYIYMLFMNIRRLSLKELNINLIMSLRLIHLALYLVFKENWLENLVTCEKS